MGILRKIKSVLPASSRSFHGRSDYRDEQLAQIRAQISELREVVDGMRGQVSEISRGVHEIIDRTNQLDVAVRTNRSQLSLLEWQNYRREDEALIDAKKRFFRSLPPAQGTSRVLQRGCAALLAEFHELCQQYGLSYWADFGTLIGAVRHEGFIPWDDDVDLGMIRADIDKLIDIISTRPDLAERYRVSVVYDPYVLCRQIRFMYADEKNPSFLDLFLYDYSSQSCENAYEKRNEIRHKLIDELHSAAFFDDWISHGYLRAGEKYSADIEAIFEKYRQKALTEGIIKDEGADESSRIMYGIDNIDAAAVRLYANDDIFPLKSLLFEGKQVSAPSCPEAILTANYGDIYELPSDMISHFVHVNHDLLGQSQTLEAIERAIGANPFMQETA